MKALLILCTTLLFSGLSGDQTIYDFTMKSIEGEEIPLSQYKGKVVLIVNVASKCGYTPQYEELQKLYEQYQDRDFVILGFPANNFMGQEPGNDEEIQRFCRENYGVTFPMFSKISVKGDDQAALYQFLTNNETVGGKVKWNFQKYLINKNGKPVKKFSPDEKPLEDNIVSSIEKLLKS